MDRNRIEYLEAKYWKGSTDLSEERELMEAAAQNCPYLSQMIITILSEAAAKRRMELAADFDEEFWAKAEGENKIKPVIRLLNLGHFLRYAATGIILLGVGFGLWSIINKDHTNQTDTEVVVSMEDTYQNPEEALEQAKNALMFASQKLNKGTEPVKEISRFHTTQISIMGVPSTEKEQKESK